MIKKAVSRDDADHVSFPSEDILVNMTVELTVTNTSVTIAR